MPPHELPAAPGFKPAGPIVRATDIAVWDDAAAARAAAQNYLLRTARWARAAYQHEKQRGFTDGRKSGTTEAAALAASLAAQSETFLIEIEREMRHVVLALVENILGTIDTPEFIARAVRQAVTKFADSSVIRVRVAPDLVEPVRHAVQALGEFAGSQRVRVEADPGAEADSCILWTDTGNADVSLAAQVGALREGLGLKAGDGAAGATGGRGVP